MTTTSSSLPTAENKREPTTAALDVIGSLMLWAVQGVGAFVGWLIIMLGLAIFPDAADVGYVETVAGIAVTIAAILLIATAVWSIRRLATKRAGFPVVVAGLAAQVLVWSAALIIVQQAGVPLL